MALRIKRKLFMKPRNVDWEVNGVFNPTTIKDGKTSHMFYRAVDKKFVSSIGHALIDGDKVYRSDEPVLVAEKDYEVKGVEDPRVTKIGDTFYLVYVAYDGKNARVAYAVSHDLKKWKKKGIISPNLSVGETIKLVKINSYKKKWKTQAGAPMSALWDKDAMLFPEKNKGKFMMLHRFLPDIQFVKFRSFADLKKEDFWENYISNMSEVDQVSLYKRYDWEGDRIGGGAVPIKTKKGWLVIYHGAEINKIKGDGRQLIYKAGAALLDYKEPRKEITRLKGPLFVPKYLWEMEDNIKKIVFPTGTLLEGDNLKIFYGASDTKMGLAEMSFRELMRKF